MTNADLGRPRATRIHLAAHLGVCLLIAALQAEASPERYRVQSGDTLSQLAQRFRTTVEELRRWNALDDDVILAGQELQVGAAPEVEGPSASSEGEAPEPVSYVVESWDTVGCIAARFGVTITEIEAWNRGLDPDRIQPGQAITVLGRRADSLDLAAERRVVGSGETLTAIADELGVSLSELIRWNVGIDPHRLSPGQLLAVRRGERFIHVVRAGERLEEIAGGYGVTAAEILGWNPGCDADQLTEGQRLVIRNLQPPSESVGSATCGRLVNGRVIQPHPGFIIRNPDRSYGTTETLRHIHDAFDAVLARHPDANIVRLHDLSLPEGGPIDDHRSHQSGRDVDIAYYQRECPGNVCPLRPVLPRELALAPQWTLLEHWLQAGVAQRILIDYGLQEVLYNYARRNGASRGDLEHWFQYPRGRSASVGVIRHFPNHFDHIHVRFVCSESDERCH